MLTRRETLQRGVIGASLLCSLETPSRLTSGRTSAGIRAAAAAPLAPFQTDLAVPPVLEPVERTGEADLYSIVQRPGLAEILPGVETPILGYDGLYPGPTIHAQSNRATRVLQTNQTPEVRVVHNHGAVAPASEDGHPADIIPVGASREYFYPNPQPAATLWYHDHVHHIQAESVYRGLAAFYLLHDRREERLDLPQDEYDVPLMIQDKSFNADGTLRYTKNLNAGFLGDTIVVNGKAWPRMAVERRRYRLRLLNASNARHYELSLGDGLPMTQIAGDLGLLPRPVVRHRIPIAPAERIEVVVDFADQPAGAELVLHNLLGAETTSTVMRFDVVGGGGSEDFRVPRILGLLPRRKRPTVARDFVLNLSFTPRFEWQINGRGFEMDRIDLRARLGTTEYWRWINQSTMAHPMHIHGFPQLMVARGSRRPPAWERGLKDTFWVNPGEVVTVQPLFDGFPGLFVYHCHILEHGDRAMMAQMEVVK